MLRLHALLLCLLVVSPLAAATVTERPISETRVGTASASASTVQATWNGERFLVTWGSFGRGAQALALDAAGRPLADTARALPVSPQTVFWRDGVWYVIGAGYGSFGWVRVSADGVPLDLQPHPIEGPYGSFEGALWTGESLIVMWNVRDPATLKTLEAVVLVYDADLQLREKHTVGKWAASVRMYSDGATVLILFHENESFNFLRKGVALRRDGHLLRQRVLDGIGFGAGGTRGDGAGYFFLTGAAPGSLTSFHIDESLVPQANAISFTPGKTARWSIDDLSWDGSAFTYFYRNESEIRVLRVADDGHLLEDGSVLALGDSSEWSSGSAAAVGMGTSVLLYARAEATPAAFDNHILRLRAGQGAASLATAPEVNLQYGAFEQTEPVAVSGDTQSLVAWQEQVSLNEPPRIYATRVQNGEVRDPQSLLLGSLSIPYPGVLLASDGDGFVAAWLDPEGIGTRHVAADGTVGPRIVIRRFDMTTSAGSLEILSNGDGYLVAWTDDYGALDRAYAVRLRAEGTIIDTAPIGLGFADGPIEGASDGSGYLLAWRGQSVMLSSGGTVTARPDLGVNVMMAAWWNGTSYSVLVYPAGPSGPGYRVAQVGVDGAVTMSAPLPRLTFDWWAWGLFDACGASGCSRTIGTVEEGEYLLREERVTPAGFEYGSSVTVAPPWLLNRDEVMRGTLFRTPRGRLWAAFERRLPQPPYAGISRIVIAPLDPPRVRSVRH
jgi:hypothetical protein